MTKFLDTVNTPADLKNLTVEQLEILADEIREFILTSVSKTGGHLASNLGIIELTLAMHYVFDFATDSLLWDVGHQCYAHKIITGRKEQFKKLRMHDGITGFPNPAESIYDRFTVGHAGTAIATAVGMALGYQQTASQQKVVSLVGDASIVNGLSFEALNNLGLVKRQLLIVLNDNSMAIDPTQGALAMYFSKLRLSHPYEDLRKTTSRIVKHLPLIGKGANEAIEKAKKYIRMALPASQIFESLNIPYFGPVDGHDVRSLVHLFRALEHMDRPVILHAYTRKGMGFIHAENDGSRFHSTGPFKVNGSGQLEYDTPAGRSYTDVLGEHLAHLAAKDSRIVAITSAMGTGTGLELFRSRYPDRYFDVGIAESAAADLAAGMAKAGLRPFVCIYSTFLQRSFDQIFQEVSLADLPVTLCIDRAGFVGSDGPTHHGMMDIGYLRMMPNLVLCAPADEKEMTLAMDYSLTQEKSVCIRYPKDNIASIEIDSVKQPFETGKAVYVRKNQKPKASIVSYGAVLTNAIAAADILAEEGIEIDVINARFAAPLDEQLFCDISNSMPIVTIEDHSLSCGFGSALLESVAKNNNGKIKNPILPIGADRCFYKHASRKSQLSDAGLSPESIATTIKNLI